MWDGKHPTHHVPGQIFADAIALVSPAVTHPSPPSSPSTPLTLPSVAPTSLPTPATCLKQLPEGLPKGGNTRVPLGVYNLAGRDALSIVALSQPLRLPKPGYYCSPLSCNSAYCVFLISYSTTALLPCGSQMSPQLTSVELRCLRLFVFLLCFIGWLISLPRYILDSLLPLL